MKKITFIAAIFLSVLSNAQIAGTSFEEPGVFTIQYVDTGDATTAHDLASNADEPFINYTSTGGEMGFSARYEPYDEPSDGLTDGDWVGVTAFAGDVGAFSDGAQGYGIGDPDGNFILEFDVVEISNSPDALLTMDYYVNETGYEGDGTENASGSDRIRIYVKDLTNDTEIDILNTEGSDINDLGIEGSWIPASVDLPNNASVQLVVEVRTNSGSETLYLDNISIDGSLNVGNNTEDIFSVYPNPVTNGYVTISSPSNGEKNIAVYDILGKQVMNTTITSDRLNVSQLNSGVYMLNISENGISSTKKLVIK